MARQNPNDIQKELKQQNEDIYGIEESDGLPVDIDKEAEKTYGESLADDEELNVANKIEEDEASISGLDSQKDE